ncbi:MAG: hypothetical protein GY711_13730 [bacterium]|nr:hypothetical protein [bacterium]
MSSKGPLHLVPLLVLAGCILCAPAIAQRKGKGKEVRLDRVAYFDGRLAEAQKQARERNVPIVILAVLEGEEASDRFRDQLRDNRTLAQGARGAIVVLVNNGTHETKKLKVKGADGKSKTVEVCEQYHTPSCEVHQRNWDGVYQEYVATKSEDGRWDLPSAYILSPKNEIAKVLYDAQPPSDSEILAALRDAQRAAGPGITLEELRLVQKLTADGQLMMRAKGWADAYRHYSGVLGIVATGKYGEEAERESKAALEWMRKDLDAAAALLTPESVREGYTKLHEMTRAYAGSPLEKPVADALKSAARNPELKEAVAALKVEFAAEDLWEDAQELLRKGDDKGAKKLLRKILGKRYAATPAAERVRTQHPELVKK